MSLCPAKAGIEVFVQQPDAAQRGGEVKAGAHSAAANMAPNVLPVRWPSASTHPAMRRSAA